MNTRTLFRLTLGALAIGACGTRTAIGDLPGVAGAGEPTGTSGTLGTIAAAAAGGASGMGAAGGFAGSAAPIGPYVPSGDQVLNDPLFTNPSGISGDWVGYLENGTPGSEEVLLRFGTDANGHATLSVKRGTAALPPPPTDGLEPWPPGLDISGTAGTGPSTPQTPMLGFTSGGHGVTWTAARLRFRTIDYEPWGPWCALQTPYPVDGQADIFNCMRPNESVCPPGGVGGCTLVGINGDTRHWMMCDYGLCGCNATGCGFDVQPTTNYDITFFGDHAIGSVQSDVQSAQNLILMPAPPAAP